MVSGPWVIAVMAALLVPGSVAHPSHTSSAELVQEADSVRVALRVFADDIATVGAVRPYIDGHFGLVDRSGEPVRLEWAGAETESDVLTVRLRGRLIGGLSGARVSNAVLTDRFADQVNLVRATYQRGTATLIFTRGDGPKALP
jgi:uncharacterized protein DUF6702